MISEKWIAFGWEVHTVMANHSELKKILKKQKIKKTQMHYCQYSER